MLLRPSPLWISNSVSIVSQGLWVCFICLLVPLTVVQKSNVFVAVATVSFFSFVSVHV